MQDGATSNENINAAICHECNKPDDAASGDLQMVLCDFDIGHPADSIGVHLGCAADFCEIPEGEYKCLLCIAAEEEKGEYEPERIVNKRVASCIKHTNRCNAMMASSSNNQRPSNCNCKKKGQTTKYLVKWKGHGMSECTWELLGNIIDPTIKSTFDKHIRGRQACKKCKCIPSCICNDQAALDKAAESQQ